MIIISSFIVAFWSNHFRELTQDFFRGRTSTGLCFRGCLHGGKKILATRKTLEGGTTVSSGLHAEILVRVINNESKEGINDGGLQQ